MSPVLAPQGSIKSPSPSEEHNATSERLGTIGLKISVLTKFDSADTCAVESQLDRSQKVGQLSSEAHAPMPFIPNSEVTVKPIRLPVSKARFGQAKPV